MLLTIAKGKVKGWERRRELGASGERAACKTSAAARHVLAGSDKGSSLCTGLKGKGYGPARNGFPAGPVYRRCRTPHPCTPQGLAPAARRFSGLHQLGLHRRDHGRVPRPGRDPSA
ncbi:uncharacterized protein ACIBXB_018181 isoform 2-T3 [Morphnus guianensis]